MTEEGRRWAPLPPTAPPGTACTAHKHHQPVPTYCELHHVIPQAWQAAWAPEGRALASHEEVERTADWERAVAVKVTGLWDPRTVALCPTGHRNVHYWLVKLMHAMPAEMPEPPEDDITALGRLAKVLGDAQEEVRVAALKTHTRPSAQEFGIACEAITRIVGANDRKLDVLAKLVAGGMWGEA